MTKRKVSEASTGCFHYANSLPYKLGNQCCFSSLFLYTFGDPLWDPGDTGWSRPELRLKLLSGHQKSSLWVSGAFYSNLVSNLNSGHYLILDTLLSGHSYRTVMWIIPHTLAVVLMESLFLVTWIGLKSLMGLKTSQMQTCSVHCNFSSGQLFPAL